MKDTNSTQLLGGSGMSKENGSMNSILYLHRLYYHLIPDWINAQLRQWQRHGRWV